MMAFFNLWLTALPSSVQSEDHGHHLVSAHFTVLHGKAMEM